MKFCGKLPTHPILADSADDDDDTEKKNPSASFSSSAAAAESKEMKEAKRSVGWSGIHIFFDIASPLGSNVGPPNDVMCGLRDLV